MMRMRKLGRRVNRVVLVLIAVWLTAWITMPGWADEAQAPAAPAVDASAAPAPAEAAASGAEPADAAKEPADAEALAVITVSNKVAVVTLADEIIMGGAEEYLVESIGRAEREDYGLLVIEMDTPGGSVQDTQNIVKSMLASQVPIAVYVHPKGAHAGSAGTFITLAGHIAAMAPGTRIGAAHPVQMFEMPDTGNQQETEEQRKKREEQKSVMAEKMTNDVAGFMVSIAKERGRNVEWAEQSVRKSIVATSDEALEKKVIDLIAEDLNDLLAQIHGREIALDSRTKVKLNTEGAQISRWEMTLKQRVWSGLANPNVLMILILLGLAGIGMEFYHPGMIFPGAVGAICLLMAAISIKILPVSVGGLLLVLVGVGLMIAEAYVTSYGLLGIAGAGLMILGGILLIDPSAEPHYMDANVQVDWSVLIAAAVAFGGMFLAIGYFVVKTQRGKIQTGAEGMVGDVGEARSDVGPEGGKVFVHGEWWTATSDEPISEGGKVEVVEVLDGMKLKVKPKG